MVAGQQIILHHGGTPDRGSFSPSAGIESDWARISSSPPRTIAGRTSCRRRPVGSLTPEERAELEEFLRVGSELAVLQSKARLSLKRVTSSP